MQRYTDNGDGTYSGAGEVLYDTFGVQNYLIEEDADGYDEDASYTDDVYGLESQGSGRPVTIEAGGGAYFDQNGTEYYNQNDGTFIDENGDVFDVVW